MQTSFSTSHAGHIQGHVTIYSKTSNSCEDYCGGCRCSKHQKARDAPQPHKSPSISGYRTQLAATEAQLSSDKGVCVPRHGGMRPRSAVEERDNMNASPLADALRSVGREAVRLLRWLDLREWSRISSRRWSRSMLIFK